jgi:hypothetical protein
MMWDTDFRYTFWTIEMKKRLDGRCDMDLL